VTVKIVKQIDKDPKCPVYSASKMINDVVQLYEFAKSTKYPYERLFTIETVVNKNDIPYVVLRTRILFIIPIIFNVLKNCDHDIVIYDGTHPNRLIDLEDPAVESAIIHIRPRKRENLTETINLVKSLNNNIIKYMQKTNINGLYKDIEIFKNRLNFLSNSIEKPVIKTPNFQPFNDTPFKKPYVKIKADKQILLLDKPENINNNKGYIMEATLKIHVNIYLRNLKQYIKKQYTEKIANKITNNIYGLSYGNGLLKALKQSNVYDDLFVTQLAKGNYNNIALSEDKGFLVKINFKKRKGGIGFIYYVSMEDSINFINLFQFISSHINNDIKIITQIIYNTAVLQYITLNAYATHSKMRNVYKDKINEFLSVANYSLQNFKTIK